MHTRFVGLALFAATLITTALISSPAFAQVAPEQTVVSLTLNSWQPEPEISLEDLEFVNTLGIEKKRFNDFRLTLGRAHKLRFSYLPIKYDDTGKVITTTVTFQGGPSRSRHR